MRLAAPLAAVLATSIFPLSAAADAISIEHEALGCVEAGKFPRMRARFDPEASVARARVYFKPEGWPTWYSVPMKKEGESFWGVLPKPENKLARFDYYISVLDATFGESRTAEYGPSVVAGAGACGGKKVMALGLAKAAQVLVAGPEGAAGASLPLVPAGFSGQGVIAAAPAAGSSATTAVLAGGAAGGGIGATALIVGGVAVAGGGVAIAAKSGGGSGGGGSTSSSGSGGPPTTTAPPTTAPPATTRYHVDMLPFVDVSICANRRLTFAGGPLDVDASGNFNQIWQPPNDPNVTRMVGHLDATTFAATFSCLSGSPSTSLSATGSGGVYRGTFSFNGSSGTLTVAKQ